MLEKAFRLVFFTGIVYLLSSCNIGSSTEHQFAQELPQKLDFNFHIKPILSDRCYSCHGPDEKAREADLRLDREEDAFNALKNDPSTYPIVAGNAHKSAIFQRISSSDPELQMPPPSSKLHLSAYEIALIEKWIEQGAEWKDHWAFIPPSKGSLPISQKNTWVQNEIDHFILKKLEDSGLQPSPTSDKASLLRRLSFDLRGLPPSLDELDQFLADENPAAFENWIDRFLEDPAYGERMAADWMDVARYADTHGYLDDTHREVWQWREWVIKSFNENLPYDQFIIWQTAGDLLPNPTKEQILATCFQRLHRQNQEGGVLPEEYRVEYVADRVQTTSKAFLGLTMECARCHDHKYDPISQKEYYSMAAFFNSTFETGRAPIGYESGPTMLLTDDEVDAQIKSLKGAISNSKSILRQKEQSLIKAFDEWMKKERFKAAASSRKNTGLLAHFSFDKSTGNTYPNIINPRNSAIMIKGKAEDYTEEGFRGKAIQFDEENAVLFGKKLGQFDRTDPFSFNLAIFPAEAYQDASIFDNCDHKWHAYRGYELRIKEGKLLFRISHNYPQNALEIISEQALPVNQWSQIAISYDGSSKAEGMQLYLNGEKMPSKIILNHLYKSSLHTDKNDMVVMPYFGLKMGWRMNDPSLLDGKLDEFSIYSRELSPLEIADLHQRRNIKDILLSNSLEGEELDLLKDYYLLSIRDSLEEEKRLKKLEREENKLLSEISEIMVLGDQQSPRPTFVLNRGVYDDPLEEVFMATPEKILPFPEEAERNRLGLAKWLVSPNNPLTARVMVNRLWQMCFGEGLVRTPDDFGSQGALPSHPDLLDFLAVNFIESGYDIKAMLKFILSSATYQQSSVINEELLEKDPDNILLARAPRYRLSAEMLRDQALAASELLVRKPGGESIKPYQPKGLWAEAAFQAWANYQQDTGEDLYKRSLYIYWKRNTPHPFMTTFDIPDRASCTVKRLRTSSPLQSLMLLNYPQFPEAARALAEWAMKKGGENLEERLVFIYRKLSSHFPDETSMQLMKEFYESEYKRFQEEEGSAQDFLSVGEYELQAQTDLPQLASLASLSLSLLNTTPVYMKQ